MNASGWIALASIGAFLTVGRVQAEAGVIFNFSDSALGGGSRWDAAPRSFNFGETYERSLDGGLRYSLQGGSYEGYRNLFTWSSLPSVSAFQTAVEQAFAAWTVPDPVSGLTTQVSFAADFATPVMGVAGGSGGVDVRGAEIDLFGSTDAAFWNPGNGGTQAETWFNDTFATVTLTSGTANYPGSRAIAGADITVNSNPQAVYTLDLFRRLLSHEIGHALGLGDVEGDISPGRFIDDNYDAANSTTAQATLNNSWTHLVDAMNPAASPLSRYTVAYGNPGTLTNGVDILMESRGLGIAAGNPLGNMTPLTNDDFGTRQFLYPSTVYVPEPGTLALATMGFAVLAGARWRRRKAV